LGDANQLAGCLQPQQISKMAENVPPVLQLPAFAHDNPRVVAAWYHQYWFISSHLGTFL
jgi:hypothetical protein